MSTFLKCCKMEPFQQSFQTQAHQLPKYQHINRKIHLQEFQGRHNRVYHSMFFFLCLCKQPIQSHIIYRHPWIKNKITQVMTIFSGLMSLWMISFSCKYSTAEHTCLSFIDAYSSAIFLDLLMKENKDPSSMYSNMR